MTEEKASGLREVTLNLPTGEVLYTRISPVARTEGCSPTVLHVILDLSTTSVLQHQFDGSRERPELALAYASAGTWEWDIVNDRVVWECSLNRTPTGQTKAFTGPLPQALPFVHPQDPDGVQRSLLDAANGTCNDCRIEFRLGSPGVPIRHVVAQTKLHRDNAGHLERIVGLSPEGTILSWNAAAARICGYTAGGVIGKHFTTVIQTEGCAEVLDLLECAKSGTRITDYEAKRITKQSQSFYIALLPLPWSSIKTRTSVAFRLAFWISLNSNRLRQSVIKTGRG